MSSSAYGKLPDHINCSFIGSNSPVTLRAEAGTAAGGMVVEEHLNATPHVHLYGDTNAAREQFGNALRSFGDYISSLSRHDIIRSEDAFVSPTWFNIEIRRPTYRATLWGDEISYNLSWVIGRGVLGLGLQLEDDMMDSYQRLKALYERFFDTTL